MGYIELDFDFDQIGINSDGSRLAVFSSVAGYFSLFKLSSKSKLCEFATENLLQLMAFSDDFKFLLFSPFDGELHSIVSLVDEEHGNLSFGSTTTIDIKSCSVAMFRKIHDIQHLQLVESDTGILRLYKNSKENEWDLL